MKKYLHQSNPAEANFNWSYFPTSREPVMHTQSALSVLCFCNGGGGRRRFSCLTLQYEIVTHLPIMSFYIIYYHISNQTKIREETL